MLDISPNILEKLKGRKMSEVALAKEYVKVIGGNRWNGTDEMLRRVQQTLSKHKKKFTLRRVRSFWNMEARLVRFEEMRDLAEVAQVEADTQKRIQEARKSHEEFLAETAVLVARLERGDPDFHSHQIKGLRGVISRMGGSRDQE